MEIHLENIGRRFNKEWIFKDIHFSFESGRSYAILGPNGSGKSTLMQILSAALNPSSGKISYRHQDKNIDPDDLYRYLSISAPYMELIEDFSLSEMIDFHFSIKSYAPGLDKQGLMDLCQFGPVRSRTLRFFSSGMKQRVKLLLSVCSDSPILFLDEPTSNLDAEGIAWYRDIVQRYRADRLLIVCSNQEHEYDFCDQLLRLSDYK